MLNAYYGYHSANALETALGRVKAEESPALYLLMADLLQRYQSYNQGVQKQWCIQDPDAIQATSAFVDYVAVEKEVASREHPVYTLVSLLPCYYLWDWFSGVLLDGGMAENNLYRSWLEGLHNPELPQKIGSFLDAWQQQGNPFDAAWATTLFTKAMHYELGLFTEA